MALVDRILLVVVLLALTDLHLRVRRIESKIDNLRQQSFLHVRRKDQP